MKISYRILAINFLTLFIIISGSAIAFYSVLYNVLTTQQSKHLLSTANDFVYDLESRIDESERSFIQLLPVINNPELLQKRSFEVKNIDFVLKTGSAKSPRPQLIFSRGNIGIPLGVYSLQDFFITNPYLILRSYTSKAGEEYIYGFNLEREYLGQLATRLRTDAAIYLDYDLIALTNESVNQRYFYLINQAFSALSMKNNYEIHIGDTENSYIISTLYRVKASISNNKKMYIVVFSTLSEVETYKNTIKYVLVLLFIVSLILTFILSVVFSGSIRKNLSTLIRATQNTMKGDFDAKIPITSNDEIGTLAVAFNTMLETLKEQESIKNRYTEFISLINKTPQYNSLITALLDKIVQATGSTFGAFYTVANGTIEAVYTSGLEPSQFSVEHRSDVINKIIHSHETIHQRFDEDAPEIVAGMVKMKLSEIILRPVISVDEVVGVLQLGAMHPYRDNAIEYLDKIKEQLEIGITKVLAHKKLEEIVAELEVQKKRAEESTELKSRFLATISHELRTPLNSIMGLTELLLNDKTLGDKSRERATVIQRSSKRLLGLINEILDLSKIEAGKMELSPSRFLISEFLKDITAIFQPIAEQKGIQLTVNRLCNENQLVNTDREKLQHVVTNLLSNAIKFTNEGHVTIECDASIHDGLKIRVADTGIGISADDIHFIFDEFHQVDSSSSRVYGGSGLGLSIANKFTELLHGSIHVESEVGKGSVFTVLLPGAVERINEGPLTDLLQFEPSVSFKSLVTELKATDSLNADSRSVVGAEGQPVVLIVDDDPDSLFTINEIIKECNFSTLLAKNGFECLEILEKKTPDVILLDIMMPKMDGFQTITKIKENENWKDIPILAVTAKAMLEERHILYKYGFSGIVPKPINAGVLAFNVMKLILNSRHTDGKDTDS
ncbi:MAG: ATP-binding protein [Ignavibacteria bacterium]|nr:ATP-binding protein [Ignavibacteria bacterium]